MQTIKENNHNKYILLLEDNPDDIELTLRALSKNKAVRQLGMYWLVFNEPPLTGSIV